MYCVRNKIVTQLSMLNSINLNLYYKQLISDCAADVAAPQCIAQRQWRNWPHHSWERLH